MSELPAVEFVEADAVAAGVVAASEEVAAGAVACEDTAPEAELRRGAPEDNARGELAAAAELEAPTRGEETEPAVVCATGGVARPEPDA